MNAVEKRMPMLADQGEWSVSTTFFAVAVPEDRYSTGLTSGVAPECRSCPPGRAIGETRFGRRRRNPGDFGSE
jgi:hypothetical protein